VCDQEKILKVFRITGLTKVFPIHASLGDALALGPEQVSARTRSDSEPPRGSA
jgi:anti-sigma B factor antagonist